MKIMVFVSAAGYALFMFVIFLIHLATSGQTSTVCKESLGSEYSDIIWEHGCTIKIPFCKSMFEPSCDCAAIDIKKHNMTKLPKEIAVLKNLQKFSVQNGPLESLPSELKNLQHLVKFHVPFNRIKKFDIDISNWKNLTT